MIIDTKGTMLAKILECADLAGRDVLEIGCGDGRITAGLAGKPGRLTAIDPDPKAIAAAGARVPDVTFRVGAGEDLPFPDDAFDVVLFTLSLHHQDARKALKETGRVLRKDGTALVIEPAVDGEVEIVCNVFNDETEVLNDVIRAIAESDFRVVRTETFFPEWVFADHQELRDWLFAHYRTPFDADKATQVDRLLGHKRKARPIILEDKLTASCLRRDDHGS